MKGTVQHPDHPVLQTLLHLLIFLWGYIKDRVYVTSVTDYDELKARIQEAVGTVTEDMLQNTRQEVEYRLDILELPRGHPLKFTL